MRMLPSVTGGPLQDEPSCVVRSEVLARFRRAAGAHMRSHPAADIYSAGKLSLGSMSGVGVERKTFALSELFRFDP